MATIVCLDRNHNEEIGTNEYAYLDVVDGQQRLTTIIILLKAISKALLEGDDSEKTEAKDLNRLLVKDDARVILLQTNHDSSLIFRDYLSKGEIPYIRSPATIAERNLYKAFTLCERFVREWEKKYDILELLKLIKTDWTLSSMFSKMKVRYIQYLKF